MTSKPVGQGEAKQIGRPVQHRERRRDVQSLVGGSDFVDCNGMCDNQPFFLQLAVIQRQHQAVQAARGSRSNSVT